MDHAHERSSLGADPASRDFDPASPSQIYHQGFFDGACFLYAQANAYKALTGKKVGREQWDRALALLPEPSRFLGAPGAQGLPYDEAVRHIHELLTAFSGEVALDGLDHQLLEVHGSTVAIAAFELRRVNPAAGRAPP